MGTSQSPLDFRRFLAVVNDNPKPADGNALKSEIADKVSMALLAKFCQG